jgi:hypothetical protein
MAIVRPILLIAEAFSVNTIEAVAFHQLIINDVSHDSESEELCFHASAVLLHQHYNEHSNEVEPENDDLDVDPDDGVTHLVLETAELLIVVHLCFHLLEIENAQDVSWNGERTNELRLICVDVEVPNQLLPKKHEEAC